MTDESPSSPSRRNLLHAKVHLKSTIFPDLSNHNATITQAKRGGWYELDHPEIERPVRAKEFDVVDNSDDDDNDEEGSHFSAGENDDAADDETKKSQKEEDEEDDDDDDDDKKDTKQSSSTPDNKQDDQFLHLGTTIRITKGPHTGRICTISERRVGIFLKMTIDGEERLWQPDEDKIEVIEFKEDVASDENKEAEEQKAVEENEDEKNEATTKKKKKKDFGHKKYIGALVRYTPSSSSSSSSSSPSTTKKRRGRPKKQQQQQQQQQSSSVHEAIVENAFSGEWYLVSDPDIDKALDLTQFEVVEDEEGGCEGVKKKKKGKRKRDDDDDDDSEEEDDDDEEEEEEEEFLSSMQYCGDALPEQLPEVTKSLRKRAKKVNYAENDGESSDDNLESWEEEDSEEEKDVEKLDGKTMEEEDEEVVEDDNEDGFGGDGGGGGDDAGGEDASVASVKEQPAAEAVVDLTETSESPKGEEQNNAKPDKDVQMTEAADSADGDGDSNNKKVEEEPVCSTTSAPVLLHSKKADNNKVELLLSGMSHLPPDTKIEVLNRKTGRVMRGDEAILLKDLPAALLNHADYEPIVPTSGGEANDDKEAVAEKDTPSLPTDPNFDPWDPTILVGVTVLVKSGPYRGIQAKIKEIRGSRWVLDHEAVTTTLRSSDCLFIDDGNVNKDAVAAHYGTKKNKVPMPSFVKPGTVNIGRKNRTTAAVRRVGRSDANVRVSNVVIPQARPPTRVRASAVEGKHVLVTGGEFRGLSGTISSCIPGGWYLVSNLYDDDQHLDVLIHSGKLELIDDASPKKTPVQQGHIHEQIKSSIHAKASELRMEKKRSSI